MKITNPNFDLVLILGQEPYTKRLTYGHMPDYLKAKANAELYSNAIYHCIKMERSQIAKAKIQHERGNIALAEELFNKSEAWSDKIDNCLKGKPDEFFIKMNNIPIKD